MNKQMAYPIRPDMAHRVDYRFAPDGTPRSPSEAVEVRKCAAITALQGYHGHQPVEGLLVDECDDCGRTDGTHDLSVEH